MAKAGTKIAWEEARRHFWMAHPVLLFAVRQELSPGRFEVPKLLLVPIGAIEAVVIAGIWWKTTKMPLG